VALVRVYCGLASTPKAAARDSSTAWLTVAVVDDAGRLLDVCDIGDDSAGYAELGALLAERSGGTAGLAVAADSDEHVVTLLLAAAGRPLAIADEDALDDYAERFGDDDSPDEMEAPQSERRAIGLARALQAGALAAAGQVAPRELMALKPVLAAHAALTAGRQGAAVALREVLRELYPAALRAYPDPAAPIPLAILDALPEPGLLGSGATNRGRDAAVAGDLAKAGVSDLDTITEAITSLRVAVSETPRRAGIGKTLTTAVAETIRQSVAAVRACDGAILALIGLLDEKATPVAVPVSATGGLVGATRSRAVSTTPLSPLRAVREQAPAAPAAGGQRRARPAAQTPAAAQQPAAGLVPPIITTPIGGPSGAHAAPPGPVLPAAAAHSAPSHAAPTSANRAVPQQSAAAAGTVQPSGLVLPPGVSPSVPRQPGYATGTQPIVPPRRAAMGASPLPSRPQPQVPADQPFQGYPPFPAPQSGQAQVPTPRLAPEIPAPGSREDWPLSTNGNGSVMPPPPAPPVLDPTAYQPSALPPTVLDQSGTRPAIQESNRVGRVTPPWLADDLPAEPAPLRLVEPESALDRVLRENSQAIRQQPNDFAALREPSQQLPRQSSYALREPSQTLPQQPNYALREPSQPLPSYSPLREPSQQQPSYALREPSQQQPSYALREPSQPLPMATPGTGYNRYDPPGGYGNDPLNEPMSFPPSLRLVNPGNPADLPSSVSDDGDGDLLIFAEARSAWFSHTAEHSALSFDSQADAGWRAAARANSPVHGDETGAGLPRRVPQANLVPGSPLPPAAERPLRIVRDPAAMAAHTTGYFRGSRRGEEVRGFAVGGRPGREQQAGWDFSRDNWDGEDQGYEYRSAAQR
jgi:hypothetical protein